LPAADGDILRRAMSVRAIASGFTKDDFFLSVVQGHTEALKKFIAK
jgi:hypothetical protein